MSSESVAQGDLWDLSDHFNRSMEDKSIEAKPLLVVFSLAANLTNSSMFTIRIGRTNS